MPGCVICGVELAPEAKSCGVCGSSIGTAIGPVAVAPAAPAPPPAAESRTDSVEDAFTFFAFDGPAATPKECPDCQRVYDAGHTDPFCACGAELRPSLAGTGQTDQPIPTALPVGVVRPPGGTTCLVVYSADRQPLLFHPLDRDVTLIGRTDALRGNFPDLDLGKLLDETVARKVSRKHAVVLRSRDTGRYVLRPLAQNTGTQVERDLATELQDYPLSDGTRVVLGGTVRLKFEVIR